MPAFKNIAGQRFGRLIALERHGTSQPTMWLCRCDCGATTAVRSRSLVAGLTRSCWCFRREVVAQLGKRAATRGQTDTPTWRSWKSMLDRCRYPTSIGWKNYGGRGIGIDDPRWFSFPPFLEDMGERPPGTTLDRRDNDLGYSKGNCRWATQREQRANQTRRTPSKSTNASTVRSEDCSMT